MPYVLKYIRRPVVMNTGLSEIKKPQISDEYCSFKINSIQKMNVLEANNK